MTISGNTFEGFDPKPYPDMNWGWNSDDPVFESLIAEVRPQTIVEVGTWLGKSAIHMARLTKAYGLISTIYCVDTWLGSPEMWMDWHPNKLESMQALGLKHGHPTIYYQFLANVVRADCDKIIVPVPQTSENAAVIFNYMGIRGDLIYLDAAHDEPMVYRDLTSWYPQVRPGGVLFGDDYNWPSVQAAVKRFCEEKHLSYTVDGVKWAISISPL